MKLICGDSLTELKKLDAGIVQTCVTSPPYYGLRNYGVEGQLGLEKTPEKYTAKMVEIFREVRRVLRNDGTLWLNLGDSFASGKGTCYNPGGGETSLGKERKAAGAHPLDRGNKSSLKKSGLKPKDLVGIPFLVVLALRSDGWYYRQTIIWSKPNPMPESATDRPTTSHEYIFLMSKSGKALFWTHRDTGEGVRVHPEPDYRWIHKDTGEETTKPQSDKKKWRRINLWRGHDYYYDAEAIKESSSGTAHSRGRGTNPKCFKKPAGWQEGKGAHDKIPKGRYPSKQNPSFSSAVTDLVGERNKRSVWTVASEPFPDAHFATFPPKLIEPCVLAGSASKACGKCGAAWGRITETQKPPTRSVKVQTPPGQTAQGAFSKERFDKPIEVKTLGFSPSCKCQFDTKPSIVLDPFAGSGTTCLMAEQKGRDYIGIELNPSYIKIARRRLRNMQKEMFV